MTERTFTIDEVRQIFRAGVEQGGDEATACEWGSTCSQSTDDAFKSAIEDILYNRSREWPSKQDVIDFLEGK